MDIFFWMRQIKEENPPKIENDLKWPNFIAMVNNFNIFLLNNSHFELCKDMFSTINMIYF